MQYLLNNFKNKIQQRQLKYGAALLITLGVIFFAGLFTTQFTSSASYSMAKQSISELGITSCETFKEPVSKQVFYVCSPLHLVMDGTFIVDGILTMLAVRYVLATIWSGRKLRKFGLSLIFLGGIEEVVAGSSPLNLTLILHSISGALAINCMDIGLILLGFAVVKKQRFLGWFTLLCGLVGMVGLAQDSLPPYRGLGYGGWERVAGFPFEIWCIGLGLYMLYVLKCSITPRLPISLTAI